MDKIYCKRNSEKHDFFIEVGKEKHYLFSQSFKQSVERFYSCGVSIDRGLSHGIGRKDFAIHHTMDKLKTYIRYIEIEYDIIILKRTMKKNRRAA